MPVPSRRKPVPYRFRPAVEELEPLILLSAVPPAPIRSAYGITPALQNTSGSTGTNGAGQTIAIIDAYDLPSMHPSTGKNDLQLFDAKFGLSDLTLGSTFLIENQLGQGNLVNLPPRPTRAQGGTSATIETALDVEAAHAIAPGATIILFEANSLSFADLMTAIDTARNTPGVVAISMSFGATEFVGETAMDSHFATPTGHIGGSGLPGGITFVASTGDDGSWLGPQYPSVVPSVLAVGATALNVNADGSFNFETAWSSPVVSGSGNSQVFGIPSTNSGGSTGGFSIFEPEPAYQNGVQASGQRTTPDVSIVGDPATGFQVIDQTYGNAHGIGSNPFAVGGTSASAPQWAGMIALVDQYRAVHFTEGSLDGGSQTLPALYDLFQTNPTDFHLTQTGYNGYTAGPYYNLVTGMGSPVANLLVPDLAATSRAASVSPLAAGSLAGLRLPNAQATPILVELLPEPLPQPELPPTPGTAFGPVPVRFSLAELLNSPHLNPIVDGPSRLLGSAASAFASSRAPFARIFFATEKLVGLESPGPDVLQALFGDEKSLEAIPVDGLE